MDYDKLFKSLVSGSMNCLEECFGSFNVAAGRQALHMLIVCLVFLVYSVAAEVFDVFTFVDWYEAVLAVGLALVIVFMNYKNTLTVVKMKEFLGKEVGHK